MEIQKVIRVNLNDFEKSELINLALHNHRLFLMYQIENNIYIHPDEKNEQYIRKCLLMQKLQLFLLKY
jgi:hypothetical protein